jgi:hypothetical protein
MSALRAPSAPETSVDVAEDRGWRPLGEVARSIVGRFECRRVASPSVVAKFPRERPPQGLPV